MRKLVYILFCLCFAAVAGNAGVFAEESSAEATIGVEVFGGDEDNAKFREYRYNTDDEFGAFADVDYFGVSGSDHYYDFSFEGRTREDVDVDFETGTYGVYEFDAGFRRMGHNFAFDAPTLYSGSGTGTLTIPDATQTNLQGSTSATNLVSRLTPYVNSANKIDFALKRDTMEAGLEWLSLGALSINTDILYEQREGTRPHGGNFGFGNAVEIPEPIDYGTLNLGADMEYAGEPFYGKLAYKHSTFKNDIKSVLYDNPFRITDSTNPSAYSQTYAGGASTARNALPPDNTYDSITGTLSRNLGEHTRVTGMASFGRMEQEDALLPVTTNSAISVAALPQGSADNKVETTLYDVSVSTKAAENLELEAGYRYDKHDNKSKVLTIAQYVRADAVIEGSSTPNYVSYIKRTAELGGTYELSEKTSVGLTYENESNSFENGSARSEDEDIYELSLNTRPSDRLSGRVSYEHSEKDSDYPDYTSANAEIPWMRKYYAASRDRDRVTAMGTVAASDTLSVTLEYIFGVDDYEKSQFGLQDDKHHILSLDADYQYSERLSFNPYYTYEWYESRQRSRQWTPGAIGDPYSAAYSAIEDANNWTLEDTEDAHTLGLVTDAKLVEDKLDLKLDWFYTVNDGEASLNSPVGTASNDSNAYNPLPFGLYDDTKRISLGANLKYHLSEDVALSFGYLFDKWEIRDYNYDGYTKIMVTATGAYNGLLSSDTLYRDYEAHTGYASLTLDF